MRLIGLIPLHQAASGHFVMVLGRNVVTLVGAIGLTVESLKVLGKVKIYIPYRAVPVFNQEHLSQVFYLVCILCILVHVIFGPMEHHDEIRILLNRP